MNQLLFTLSTMNMDVHICSLACSMAKTNRLDKRMPWLN